MQPLYYTRRAGVVKLLAWASTAELACRARQLRRGLQRDLDRSWDVAWYEKAPGQAAPAPNTTGRKLQ